MRYNTFRRIVFLEVSKYKQNQTLQFDALKKYDCNKIFHGKILGISKSRLEYEKVEEILSVGDELVVWDIVRLRTTVLELIMLVNESNQKGILFKSISQSSIDITTKEQRSIRDIVMTFSILSTTTVRKILTDNNVPFQVYKKAKEDVL